MDQCRVRTCAVSAHSHIGSIAIAALRFAPICKTCLEPISLVSALRASLVIVGGRRLALDFLVSVSDLRLLESGHVRQPGVFVQVAILRSLGVYPSPFQELPRDDGCALLRGGGATVWLGRMGSVCGSRDTV